MVTADLVRAGLVLGAAALIWVEAPPLTVYVIATLAAVAARPSAPRCRRCCPSW